jgi:hypothetical protein
MRPRIKNRQLMRMLWLSADPPVFSLHTASFSLYMKKLTVSKAVSFLREKEN